jgi:hypothetical protein
MHTTQQKNTIERQKMLILYYSPVVVTARDHRPLYGLILPGALSLKYKKKSAFNHIYVYIQNILQLKYHLTQMNVSEQSEII